MNDASKPSLLPPQWFVDRMNTCEDRRGMPYLTALDPLVLLSWHLVTEPMRKPFPIMITGV